MSQGLAGPGGNSPSCVLLWPVCWLTDRQAGRQAYTEGDRQARLGQAGGRLTLDEVQLGKQLELARHVQLEVTEGRICSQREALQGLDRLGQPVREREREREGERERERMCERRNK